MKTSIIELLRYIKFKLKKFLRNEIKITYLINNNIKQIACVDIGASYYPHKKWDFFIDSEKINWIAIDPNEKNLKYLNFWRYKSKILKITKPISFEGGIKNLYITNVDSGSSLLEPILNSNSIHRETYDYYFPFQIEQIKTITLNDILGKFKEENILLKLDIQGIEGNVIKSIDKDILQKILLIETEQNFNLIPTMKGTSKFYELQKFLEKNDFEILEIEPVPYNRKISSRKINRLIICESNIIFAKSHDFILSKSIHHCFALMGVYLSYKFYDEIIGLGNKILKIEKFQSHHKTINQIIKILK